MSTEIKTSTRRDLGEVRRIVVKVGSAVIAGQGILRPECVARLAKDAADLRGRGYEVTLVVSGAVAAGYAHLGFSQPPDSVVERQAAASIGQHRLMSTLDQAFSAHGLKVAQLLMSAEDIENRRRYLSARHTIQMLLARGILPIINENDALSDDEVKVGDNDHLAALITSVASADLLVILSRVRGLYANGSGEVISEVEVGSNVDHHISASISDTGVGGMAAKVSAAHLASRWNVPTVIADGTQPGLLTQIAAGEPIGTLFIPHGRTLTARKRWIAVRTRSRGAIRVDDGARNAIVERNASLLAKGVIDVEGDFPIGSRVDIRDTGGSTFAVGLASYPANDVRRIRGHHVSEIEGLLGYVYTDEIIHRDDMVVLGS